MRRLIVIISIIILPKLTISQDTSKLYVGIEAEKVGGWNFVPTYEKMWNEKRFTFGANVSYHWNVLGPWSHFSIKNQLYYKFGDKVKLGIQPFWLRAYSKDIGYQIPTSIIARIENGNIQCVVDLSYWSRSFYPSITIRKLIVKTTDL